MSRCGHTESLEALVLGELNVAQSNELRAHATHCSRCHHELNWLETEHLMFRARAANEQVAPLMRAERRRVSPMAIAAAASLVLMTGVMKLISGTPLVHSHADASVNFEAALTETEVETAESRDVPVGCSQLPQGVGFHCTSPASFLAIR